MINFLSGKKTYLIVIAGVIFNGLVASGYADENLREPVNTILGFMGLGTLRDGINTK